MSFANKETPPRMWGRLAGQQGGPEIRRNTPTHVGKTGLQPRIMPFFWKHPHACGEDQASIGMKDLASETPPRMWGRRLNSKVNRLTFGNPPTHVGKTLMILPVARISWKHPHACGEDFTAERSTTTPMETPPRMWGRRHTYFMEYSKSGNTPTHVGKTK